MNEIYRMLSVMPMCLKTVSKMMNIALKLIDAYIVSSIEDFKNGAVNELRLVLTYMEEAKQNSRLQSSPQTTTLKEDI